jgi:hypothetical protein
MIEAAGKPNRLLQERCGVRQAAEKEGAPAAQGSVVRLSMHGCLTAMVRQAVAPHQSRSCQSVLGAPPKIGGSLWTFCLAPCSPHQGLREWPRRPPLTQLRAVLAGRGPTANQEPIMNTVEITITLTETEAGELAQFLKRVCFSDFRSRATSDARVHQRSQSS